MQLKDYGKKKKSPYKTFYNKDIIRQNIKIAKMLLTFIHMRGIIVKLSRETRGQTPAAKLENCINRQRWGKSFIEFAEKFGRKRQLPQKTFSKNFKKVLDKPETT